MTLKLIFILLIKSNFNLKNNIYFFQGFTGIDQPYEKPTNPEVKIILSFMHFKILFYFTLCLNKNLSRNVGSTRHTFNLLFVLC